MKTTLLTVFFFVSACSQIDENPTKLETPIDPVSLGKRFVDDGQFRQELLADSVVNPENGYSVLRSENYGPGKKWETLEIWNPEVRHLTNETENETPFETFPEIDFDTITANELRTIGKAAFETFPLAVDLELQPHTQRPEEVGLWVNNTRVGGLVEVSLPSGVLVAKTCSTCHANTRNGKLTYGLANSNFEYGRVLGADWGHGTVDVTPDGKNNPTSIPDIRPIRFQEYLHWAATLKNSLGALAVRIETLFITSLSKRLRPPRDVAFALAYYFWTLDEEKIAITETQATVEPGFKHFKTYCVSCHLLDGTTGAPVDLMAIGTNNDVGLSSRGTGKYRIPSLRNVATRGRFLHDASLESLESLLMSQRLETIPGHVFGLTLTESERQELLDFLELL